MKKASKFRLARHDFHAALQSVRPETIASIAAQTGIPVAADAVLFACQLLEAACAAQDGVKRHHSYQEGVAKHLKWIEEDEPFFRDLDVLGLNPTGNIIPLEQAMAVLMGKLKKGDRSSIMKRFLHHFDSKNNPSIDPGEPRWVDMDYSTFEKKGVDEFTLEGWHKIFPAWYQAEIKKVRSAAGRKGVEVKKGKQGRVRSGKDRRRGARSTKF
jgi:hypothetical protein